MRDVVLDFLSAVLNCWTLTWETNSGTTRLRVTNKKSLAVCSYNLNFRKEKLWKKDAAAVVLKPEKYVHLLLFGV